MSCVLTFNWQTLMPGLLPVQGVRGPRVGERAAPPKTGVSASGECTLCSPISASETHARYAVSRSTWAMLRGHCHIAGIAGHLTRAFPHDGACWGPCCGCSDRLTVLLGLLLPICLSSKYEQVLIRRSSTCTPWRHSRISVSKLYTLEVQMAASQPEQSSDMIWYSSRQHAHALCGACAMQSAAACSTLDRMNIMRTLGKPQPWPVLPFMLLLIDGTVDLGLAEWLADILPRCGDRTPLSQCCPVVSRHCSAAPPQRASVPDGVQAHHIVVQQRRDGHPNLHIRGTPYRSRIAQR